MNEMKLTDIYEYRNRLLEWLNSSGTENFNPNYKKTVNIAMWNSVLAEYYQWEYLSRTLKTQFYYCSDKEITGAYISKEMINNIMDKYKCN